MLSLILIEILSFLLFITLPLWKRFEKNDEDASVDEEKNTEKMRNCYPKSPFLVLLRIAYLPSTELLVDNIAFSEDLEKAESKEICQFRVIVSAKVPCQAG